MSIVRGLAILVLLLIGFAGSASAQTCPATLSACPSPSYNAVTMSTLASGPITVTGASTAALLADGAGITGRVNGVLTAMQIYHNACGGCGANVDGVRGIAYQTPGSTVTNVNGLAGYVFNQNANTNGGQNAVAVFGVGVAAADSSATWGINTIVSDNVAVSGVTNGTGRFLYNEFDFETGNAATQIIGLVLQGGSAVQPASANGFVVSPLHLGYYNSVWSNAFVSNNGASTVALFVGTLGNPATASLPSQSIAFINTNASAAQQVTTLSSLSLGAGPGLAIAGNGGLTTRQVVLTPYTVATLPTCNAASNGSMTSVTDATSPSYNATVSGSGSVHVPVFCNGSAWTAH